MTTPTTLEKQPSESRLYSFTFAADMATGETISSVDTLTFTPSTPSAPLVVGSSSTSGQVVQVRISAGLSPTTYKGTCRITTSAGNKLEIDGYLRVEEK